eukprot:gene6478-15527_t
MADTARASSAAVASRRWRGRPSQREANGSPHYYKRDRFRAR